MVSKGNIGSQGRRYRFALYPVPRRTITQLYKAKQAIRPGKEQEAENRAQEVYGEKYNPLLMFDSKKAVSRMLHEDMERQAVRKIVRQAQKG